jgi:hypothetical protein
VTSSPRLSALAADPRASGLAEERLVPLAFSLGDVTGVGPPDVTVAFLP